MLIYNQERKDGLKESLTANNSVAYCSKLEPFNPDEQHKNKIMASLKSEASRTDNDLYYLQAVLVSTCWNLNDDVFDTSEVYAAKDTPLHKPSNIEHREAEIVGHITDRWLVDDKGSIVTDIEAVEDLPKNYDIVVGAVIYKHWENPELDERAKKLIADIESGNKFVSMECLFRGFDYAVVDNTNQSNHIIARNEESAFLTKHLRAYGGSGAYDNFKIGRLLRNIVFSAKGYVDTPANPGSIIFNNKSLPFVAKSKRNSLIEKTGVLLSCNTKSNLESSKMENDVVQKQNEKLQAQVDSLLKERMELQDKLSAADVKKYEQQVSDLQNKVEELTKSVESRDSELAEAKATLEEVKKELETITTSKAELEAKVEEANKANLIATRVSSLVDRGVDKEKAESMVSEFESLTDKQFESFINIAVSAFPPKKDDGEEKKDDKKKDEKKDESKASEELVENADEEVLDSAEANENAALNINDEEDSAVAKLRSDLSSFFQSELNSDNGE